MRHRPGWAEWVPATGAPPWTVGVEEEVMLLDRSSWALAHVIDDVLPALSPSLASSVAAETHAGTLELATRVHASAADAINELSTLRARLAGELADAGLRVAAAGTHPLTHWHESRVSAGARYQLLESSLRELTRREPTFALHVHIGIPDAETAVQVANRMRAHIPLLLALSANSPFCRGRDTGLASCRTPLFQAFPRVGIPRRFASYDDWVGSIAPLIDAGAVPESTFFWWDVRLQPRLGTVEIRIMDAQTSLDDIAALVALAQALAVTEATDRLAPEALLDAPEVLDENRFLAARDGIEAQFVDPRTRDRVPARVIVEETLDAVGPAAGRLGSTAELELVEQLAANSPADRQRAAAAGPRGLQGVVERMADAFSGLGLSAPETTGPAPGRVAFPQPT